jgi:Uma2 family endonuclease
MSAQAQPRLTPEQYLQIDRASECRNEYYDGRMYAMSGGSFPHALIIANLARHLGNALEKGACFVASSDLRLRVSPEGLYTYPDVVVVCGEPEFADDKRDTLLNPILVAEVLSPSTEAYDRGFKAIQYRTLASLREYAFVSQAEPRVEVFRRQAGRDWLLSECYGPEAVCRLESVECQIPLASLYEKVTFDPENLILRPPVR